MGQRAISLNTIIRSEKIRFGIVGVINTLVDFGVLLTLAVIFGVPTVAANIVSTSCAMATSFLLNKRAVFKDADRSSRRQIALFLLVTISGIWFVQSIVIVLLNFLLGNILPEASDAVILFISKAVATVVSLCWNYIGYSRFVFRKKER